MSEATEKGLTGFDDWYETYERDGGELLLFNTIDLAAAFETGRKVEDERIAGLLAEVERLGGEVAALRSDLSGRFFVEQVEERARRQAAREAVEIAEIRAMTHKPGSWEQQACLAISRDIRQQFVLEEFLP